jgi:hypothetical protein
MVAALLAGFVLWLAMKGRLGNYWTLLTGGGGNASPSGPAQQWWFGGSSTSSPSTSSTGVNMGAGP